MWVLIMENNQEKEYYFIIQNMSNNQMEELFCTEKSATAKAISFACKFPNSEIWLYKRIMFTKVDTSDLKSEET